MLNLQFERNYAIDMSELEKLIKPTTKLVSLTYPHNPTGATINEDTLRNIINLIEKKGVYLLLDETYRDMSFQPPPPVAATFSSRVISVSSMSKSYGLPGIRMGWIICRDEKLMQTFLAAKEQILITNSVIDEEIAYQYLLKKEILLPKVQHVLLQNFGIVKKFMREQRFLEWVEPQGGCVCFPRIKKEIIVDTKKFYELLINKYSTYVGRGGWFEENDRYMRIGYGWEQQEKLEKGLNNIVSAIGESLTRPGGRHEQ
jgi:aspartate/methionine/tyrosine aminotransferase